MVEPSICISGPYTWASCREAKSSNTSRCSIFFANYSQLWQVSWQLTLTGLTSGFMSLPLFVFNLLSFASSKHKDSFESALIRRSKSGLAGTSGGLWASHELHHFDSGFQCRCGNLKDSFGGVEGRWIGIRHIHLDFGRLRDVLGTKNYLFFIVFSFHFHFMLEKLAKALKVYYNIL